MYAIVEIAGQQFKVEQGRKIYVHRLQANEGDKLEFDQVLLVEDNGKVSVGSPVISGAKVNATVVSHLKGDKVIVFKKKRRKGYQKWNGHRQQFSQIMIDGISA
jgi:large subunit ribosomal protein L21